MPNPFEKRRTPPVIRETTVAEVAPEPEMEEVEEVPEVPEEPEGELLDPAKVLYSTNHCNSCEYFVAEGEPCRKVGGPISGDGWCVLHTAKEAPEVEEIEEVLE